MTTPTTIPTIPFVQDSFSALLPDKFETVCANRFVCKIEFENKEIKIAEFPVKSLDISSTEWGFRDVNLACLVLKETPLEQVFNGIVGEKCDLTVSTFGETGDVVHKIGIPSLRVVDARVLWTCKSSKPLVLKIGLTTAYDSDSAGANSPEV